MTTATTCPRFKSLAKTGVTSFSIAGGPVTKAPDNPCLISSARRIFVYGAASTSEKEVVIFVYNVPIKAFCAPIRAVGIALAALAKLSLNSSICASVAFEYL